MKEIYLDNSATTEVNKNVLDAMLPYFTEKWYNPSSLYSKGSNIKKEIEEAKMIVSDFINANKNEIFFTSCGSESNCWAIQGFVNYCKEKNKNVSIITSKIEHKSIIECVNNIVKFENNVTLYFIDVDKNGFVDVNYIEEILKHIRNTYESEIFVSIQFANNEIGTIQDIKNISKLVHSYNAILHVDAVQAFGQIEIDVKDFGIDMMSVSGHKIGAPKGIGFLYKNNLVKIKPIIYGTQMNGLRGGTENVPYIIGFKKAVELCSKNVEQRRLNMIDTREYIIHNLIKNFECNINGDRNERLPNNINVTLKENIMGESLIYMFDVDGIYISSGSACNSHIDKPSYVLKAIGLTDREALKTIRISLSYKTTRDDIDKFLIQLRKNIDLLCN